MSKKVRMILLIGLVVLVLVGGFGIFYYKRFLDYNQAIQAITIREPDLTQLEDGEYVGIHDVDFIRAKVKVEVKDHRFQTIKILEHVLPEKIVEQQRVTIDAVSGATNSSKVIQKAVEKALNNN